MHKKHNELFYKQTDSCELCGQNCALCSHINETKVFGANTRKEYTIQGQRNFSQFRTNKTDNTVANNFIKHNHLMKN